ncbi:hypothetical protein PT179_07850 [Erysipelothrix rhusiopathiae]|nr:hypothetical protein [Erysipelothrix rhusiopathiae]MDE8055293.1 hypothetical protein [Erysipelothrix rhusiopathiae]MDE8092963.1 hypothetical protein [Erysipelothrix rhusiopathiae]MDE8098031.1 hypothetical protein [Erysipelothrix rhusiopathiae]MDE8103344.1 hypothetical protein [Erysipelothrix rhusiopathiae]
MEKFLLKNDIDALFDFFENKGSSFEEKQTLKLWSRFIEKHAHKIVYSSGFGDSDNDKYETYTAPFYYNNGSINITLNVENILSFYTKQPQVFKEVLFFDNKEMFRYNNEKPQNSVSKTPIIALYSPLNNQPPMLIVDGNKRLNYNINNNISFSVSCFTQNFYPLFFFYTGNDWIAFHLLNSFHSLIQLETPGKKRDFVNTLGKQLKYIEKFFSK